MCYAYKPVSGSDGQIWKVPIREFRQLELEGKILPSSDGYYYAKATVPAIILEDDEYKFIPMRWDLVPRDFMKEHPEFDLATVLKKKNSRAKNPDTQKAWGFDSFNARKETLASRPAFRQSWKEGLRCAMPAIAFQERANMDGAPKEFQNRSYEIALDKPYYMGGIYDVWERKGERLESCTIITMDSTGHEKLRSIWHERHPLILKEDQLDEWLDPDTTPERAKQMVMQFDPDLMTVHEIIKKPKSSHSE
jgi:putative SOS response-associated peptidase YedK